MAVRSLSLTGVPGAAKIYCSVIKHALRTNTPQKEIPSLPKLDLKCTDIPIDHHHVQCYSEVCGFGSSSGPVLAPITYPFVLTFPLQMYLMSNLSFPHHIAGMVHLTNKIEQFANVAAGSSVEARVTLSDSYVYHEKGLCFSMTAELFDSKSQKLLWRNESLMLRRMKLTVPDSEALFESKIKEADMNTLREVEKWSLPTNMGRKYALASGDYNPIHLTSPTAWLFGFKEGAIIHGMWTKARALASVMRAAPTDIDTLNVSGETSPALCAYVEFKTPLYLPGEVSLMSTSLSGGDNRIITTGPGKESAIFQVKSVGGDQLPHVRGVCSWLTSI